MFYDLYVTCKNYVNLQLGTKASRKNVGDFISYIKIGNAQTPVLEFSNPILFTMPFAKPQNADKEA